MRTVDAFCKYMLASMAALALPGPLDTAHARFKVVYSFTGGSDGEFPHAGLINDAAGNFYGTTYEGGSGGCNGFGCGTVFRLAPDGTKKVLHTFAGGSDGAEPWDRLLKDKAGNLYGTTITGGGNGCSGEGCGIVFKVSPDRTETVLHSFTGGSDGEFPYAGLIKDAAGNLYGTTESGGTGYYGCTDGFGSGTIFRVAPDGNEKVLHSFTGPDGCQPYAQLIMDGVGNFYGTTAFGGAIGGGTVFRLAPDGTETVLHSFAGGQDGDVPYSRLIMDTAGNLYGTTAYGGNKGGGAVFKVAPHGAETLLYNLCSELNCSDGSYPYAGLFRDRSGNLYGATGYGGRTDCGNDNGCGTVFRLAPDGTEKVLHAFTGGSDGDFPVGDLIKDDAGHLYGTAGAGGDNCAEPFDRCGNVFRLDR